MMTTLLTDDLPATQDFYVNLMDFKIEFEADWFVSMSYSEGNRVAAMVRPCEFVPGRFQKSA